MGTLLPSARTSCGQMRSGNPGALPGEQNARQHQPPSPQIIGAQLPSALNPCALRSTTRALCPVNKTHGERHPSRNRGCVVAFRAEALRLAAVRRSGAPCPANKMNGEHTQPMLLEAKNAYNRRCLRASFRYTYIVCRHAQMQAHMRTGVWDYAQQAVCERRPRATRPETSTRDAASFHTHTHTHVVHDVWSRASWLVPPRRTMSRSAGYKPQPRHATGDWSVRRSQNAGVTHAANTEQCRPRKAHDDAPCRARRNDNRTCVMQPGRAAKRSKHSWHRKAASRHIPGGRFLPDTGSTRSGDTRIGVPLFSPWCPYPGAWLDLKAHGVTHVGGLPPPHRPAGARPEW